MIVAAEDSGLPFAALAVVVVVEDGADSEAAVDLALFQYDVAAALGRRVVQDEDVQECCR